MGGCCCCQTRRTESEAIPVYIYCPTILDGNQPLSSAHGTISGVSPGVLVDTNLDTSSPDTYRPPPPPLPYDAGITRPFITSRNVDSCSNKIGPTSLSDSLGSENANFDAVNSSVCENLKESGVKEKFDSGNDSPKETVMEPSKLDVPSIEEDVCPICLEEYDEENPKILTKCEHHFHLSCILEWMERSEICPICDQVMVFNHAFEDNAFDD